MLCETCCLLTGFTVAGQARRSMWHVDLNGICPISEKVSSFVCEYCAINSSCPPRIIPIKLIYRSTARLMRPVVSMKLSNSNVRCLLILLLHVREHLCSILAIISRTSCSHRSSILRRLLILLPHEPSSSSADDDDDGEYSQQHHDGHRDGYSEGRR